MTKKILILGLIIILTPILAGLYGIIHDLLTYSISPEYYTKFKFYQFELVDEGAKIGIPEIQGVAIVGFLATWWTGIPIGIILGLSGLIHNDWQNMFKIVFKSLILTLIVAFIVGLLGLLYGKLFLINSDLSCWYFPGNLIDKESFIMVGSMHNFSYIGGLVGLIFAIIYQRRQRRKIKTGGNRIDCPASN